MKLDLKVYNRRWIFNTLREYDMRIISNIGFILLAVYLILIGIVTLIPSIAIPAIIPGIIALIAGIFILIGR